MRKKLLLMAVALGGALYSPLNLDFTDPTVALDPRVTFSRAGQATRTDHYGDLEVVASGVARAHAYQDHDPASYTTSSTSNSIWYGEKTFAVSYTFTVGDRVRATYDNSNYMLGTVTAASASSVTIKCDLKVGSGTYTSWHVIRCLGFLIEEQRTNWLRNSTMQGAGIGTPPTHWSTNWSGATVNGLTFTVVGTAIEAGTECIDVNIAGTSTGTGGVINFMEAPTQAAASIGQTWSTSVCMRIVSGSQGSLNIGVSNRESDSVGGALTTDSLTGIVLTGNALATQRFRRTTTLSNAATAYVTSGIRIAGDGSSTYNVTIRIGRPQLEHGALATSFIPTTGAAAARLADSAQISGANFSSWFNPEEGTFVCTYRLTSKLTSSRAISVRADSDNTIDVVSASTLGMGGYLNVRDGAAVQTDGIPAPVANTENTRYKVAIAYKQDAFAASRNGGAAGTDSGGTVPAVNRLEFGSLGALCGHIEEVAYYRKRVPGETVERLAA